LKKETREMRAKSLIAFYMLTAALPGAAQSAESLKDFAGWHKNYTAERQGANVQAALDLLKKHGKTPAGPVVVGIVDSGVDTTVVSLKGALWTNPGERADGRDNDQNGYTDDVHGWNFLGTADGKFNMTSATSACARLRTKMPTRLARCCSTSTSSTTSQRALPPS
jgi:hypothetical protein